MAEALFNYHTRDIEELSATSCGIYGDGSSPISSNAKRALAELGIDFSHTSTPICEDSVKNADFIVGITANHARSIISMFPKFADKIYTMPKDIPDPYGCDLETYRACRNEIEACVKMLIKTLLGESDE